MWPPMLGTSIMLWMKHKDKFWVEADVSPWVVHCMSGTSVVNLCSDS